MTRGKQWTGKNSAHKTWTEINEFVDSYTATHPEEHETEWYHSWYRIFHVGRIGERRIPFQVAALLILDNPDASFNECIARLRDMIPELSTYLRVDTLIR